MFRLLETIKIRNGKTMNLPVHETRANNSRSELMGINSELGISEFIETLDLPKRCTHKLRIIYSDKIVSHTIEPYFPKIINSLRLVTDDEIDYSHKYENRAALQKLLSLKGRADDVIIVKHGFITDTSYSNLAFFDGQKYYTPAIPLLKGTKRQSLIIEGILTEELLTPADIKKFSRVYLINSMLDISYGISISTENIIR